VETIAIETKREDWAAFQFSQLLGRREGRWQLFGWTFGPPIAFVAMLLLISYFLHGWTRGIAVGLSILVPIFYLGSIYLQLKRKVAQQVELEIQNGTFAPGTAEVVLSQEGVTVTRGSRITSKTWKAVKRVISTGDYGCFFLGDDDAVLIPSRCFPNEGLFETFMKSAVIFQWHGENAIKADAYAAAHPELKEPEELKQVVIPMPSR
jgi:hypothetical protein